MKKPKKSRFTPKKPLWIKHANHPACTCRNGQCFFHDYPYTGSLVKR